jgi:hypothetical protein
VRADVGASAEALYSYGAEASGRPGGRISAAERLAKIVEFARLFHSPDGRGYATLAMGQHLETWPIRSKRFRGWLGNAYYDATRKPAPAQAMTEALALAEARALAADGLPVSLRVAEADGCVYLDLGDDRWRVVEVDAHGWRVLDRAPVRFRRAAGMLALPEPVRGGSVDDLRELVNIEDDRAWRLLVGWLLMALSPRGPYPVLVLGGEHGTAKTWTANRLRDLVDPNEAPNRAEPREPRDLMIAARNGWILAFDNISALQPWFSDGLCRLATGSGFATRELYSDDDEVIFSAVRPMILNGIGEVVTRPDLLDRSLLLTLPAIGEERRRDERELHRAFDTVRPRVLGALLDAVSTALANRDTVRLARAPRQADFARWVTAGEAGLDWPAGTFMHAYQENRSDAHELALEASPIAGPLRSLWAEVPTWEGTASELLDALAGRADEGIRRGRDWPSSPRALSGAVRRIAPNLRAIGLEVEFDRDRTIGRRRVVRFRQTACAIVQTVQTLPDATDGLDADFPAWDVPDGEPGVDREGSGLA